MKNLLWLVCALMLATACSTAGTTIGSASQAPVVMSSPTMDPSALVGEWGGILSAAGGSSSTEFVVKRVEGENVAGTVYLTGGAPYHGRAWSFKGHIRGYIFTGSAPTMPGQPTLYWTGVIGPQQTMEVKFRGEVPSSGTFTKK